jgi:hypothetical protein
VVIGIVAQASCLWGNRASRLVDDLASAGMMPAGRTAKMAVLRKKSQHLVPFALVFEHDFAKETNGWLTVIEQLVMEFLE